ncbi:unnamed protein product [Cyprideis torosa]|uniref:Uncharacterized protein n=1 Tax=Cyprideis torosa TaxID=163714 RepID=A0A7R8ZSN0_9CRUS|nr:unnamed protein product [Cyprideis torosa]CAG0896463.1 unnamed protein product [Cyprideis torosa]
MAHGVGGKPYYYASHERHVVPPSISFYSAQQARTSMTPPPSSVEYQHPPPNRWSSISSLDLASSRLQYAVFPTSYQNQSSRKSVVHINPAAVHSKTQSGIHINPKRFPSAQGISNPKTASDPVGNPPASSSVVYANPNFKGNTPKATIPDANLSQGAVAVPAIFYAKKHSAPTTTTTSLSSSTQKKAPQPSVIYANPAFQKKSMAESNPTGQKKSLAEPSPSPQPSPSSKTTSTSSSPIEELVKDEKVAGKPSISFKRRRKSSSRRSRKSSSSVGAITPPTAKDMHFAPANNLPNVGKSSAQLLAARRLIRKSKLSLMMSESGEQLRRQHMVYVNPKAALNKEFFRQKKFVLPEEVDKLLAQNGREFDEDVEDNDENEIVLEKSESPRVNSRVVLPSTMHRSRYRLVRLGLAANLKHSSTSPSSSLLSTKLDRRVLLSPRRMVVTTRKRSMLTSLPQMWKNNVKINPACAAGGIRRWPSNVRKSLKIDNRLVKSSSQSQWTKEMTGRTPRFPSTSLNRTSSPLLSSRSRVQLRARQAVNRSITHLTSLSKRLIVDRKPTEFHEGQTAMNDKGEGPKRRVSSLVCSHRRANVAGRVTKYQYAWAAHKKQNTFKYFISRCYYPRHHLRIFGAPEFNDTKDGVERPSRDEQLSFEVELAIVEGQENPQIEVERFGFHFELGSKKCQMQQDPYLLDLEDSFREVCLRIAMIPFEISSTLSDSRRFRIRLKFADGSTAKKFLLQNHSERPSFPWVPVKEMDGSPAKHLLSLSTVQFGSVGTAQIIMVTSHSDR